MKGLKKKVSIATSLFFLWFFFAMTLQRLKEANATLEGSLQAKTRELAQATEAIKTNGDVGPEEPKEDTVTKKEHENM